MNRLKRLTLTVLLSLVLSTVIIVTPYVPVTVAEAATVALNKTAITVYTGNTYQLKLTGTYNTVKWYSNDKSVTTVSTKGLVSGVRKGTATITATVGTKKYTCKVTVKSPSISSSKLTVEKAGIRTLSIVGATGKVTWKSTNTSVATVNYKGGIYAKEAGTAKIVGTYQGKSYICSVNVLKGKIQADKTDLTISEATPVTISVADLKKDENLQYEIKDTSIIDVEIGEWSGNTIPVTILPLKAGTTTILITTDYKAEELALKVSVTDTQTTLNRSLTDRMTAEEIYRLCYPSTVQINTDIALGSGFFIDKNTIVTNYHVIDGASSIKVQLPDGQSYEVSSILGFDKDIDIAVLSIPVEGIPLTLNTHGETIGETIYTIGSSQGLTGTFTNGIISKSSRLFGSIDYVQHTAAISKGNSGGPLLNAYGEVMGINTMQYVEGQNINFAININQLSRISLSNPITMETFYALN